MIRALILMLAVMPAQAKLIKVAADGQRLPDVSTTFSCVFDDAQNLLWEVKTSDGGPRDKRKVYSWFDASSPYPGVPAVEGGNGNTSGYVASVNALRLCGASDWKVPTMAQFRTLIDCPNGTQDWHYAFACSGFATDPLPAQIVGVTDQFADTVETGAVRNMKYWASETYELNTNYAWAVQFESGAQQQWDKFRLLHTRLVRVGFTPVQSCSLPTYGTSDGLLTIPQFAASAPVQSAKLRLNFSTQMFTVIEVK